MPLNTWEDLIVSNPEIGWGQRPRFIVLYGNMNIFNKWCKWMRIAPNSHAVVGVGTADPNGGEKLKRIELSSADRIILTPMCERGPFYREAMQALSSRVKVDRR